MLYDQSHGGYCCGIRNIHTLQNDRLDLRNLELIRGRVERIKEYFAGNYNEERGYCDCEECSECEYGTPIDPDDFSLLIEAVMADYQLSYPESKKALEGMYEDGWELVNTFQNDNTSNTVYVFHLRTQKRGPFTDPLEYASRWARE